MSEKQLRVWADKWLQLKSSHPKIHELEESFLRFCCGFYKSPERGRLLIVHGENGTGKSHCRSGIEKWFRRVGRNALFVRGDGSVRVPEMQSWSWPKLLDHFKEGGWGITEDLCQCELLLLDELGGGHDPSFVGVDKLCQILSARENKWTLIVTNIRPESIETTFDRRVASRFVRNSTIVDLSNVPDYNA